MNLTSEQAIAVATLIAQGYTREAAELIVVESTEDVIVEAPTESPPS